jgi:hypothetical protein
MIKTFSRLFFLFLLVAFIAAPDLKSSSQTQLKFPLLLNSALIMVFIKLLFYSGYPHPMPISGYFTPEMEAILP